VQNASKFHSLELRQSVVATIRSAHQGVHPSSATGISSWQACTLPRLRVTWSGASHLELCLVPTVLTAAPPFGAIRIRAISFPKTFRVSQLSTSCGSCVTTTYLWLKMGFSGKPSKACEVCRARRTRVSLMCHLRNMLIVSLVR